MSKSSLPMPTVALLDPSWSCAHAAVLARCERRGTCSAAICYLSCSCLIGSTEGTPMLTDGFWRAHMRSDPFKLRPRPEMSAAREPPSSILMTLRGSDEPDVVATSVSVNIPNERPRADKKDIHHICEWRRVAGSRVWSTADKVAATVERRTDTKPHR
ncbi:hypothetical protein Bbelb_321230 [Branchiostoma belcheri]|nr:hypothetical protein Bbelb_321230 [Branchiostoma belcheri]